MTAAKNQAQRLFDENFRLREALEKIAKQKLSTEMDEVDNSNADFKDGYDAIVGIARTALQPI